MKDPAILVSAVIACLIHALILFSSLGTTLPVVASAAPSIDVALVAPPAVPASAPAQAKQHEIRVPEPPPVAEPETTPEPDPIPEPAVEPTVEPVPAPEPEPQREPEPQPEPRPVMDSEATRPVAPAAREEAPSVVEISEVDPADISSADLAGDAAQPGGAVDSVTPDFDHPPAYVSNPKPRYPRAARRRGQEGKVTLLVEVLVDGRVGAVSVESASGHRLLDAAAVEAVRRWRFEPARKGHRAVRAHVRVPVEFDLKDKR